MARIIQRFSKTGSTRNRPRQGRSKKLNPRARRQVQRLASQNRRRSAADIAAEIADMGGQSVSAQTIRRTLNEVALHGRRPRRKLLLKLAHKKAPNSLLKTCSPRLWTTGIIFCGLTRLRSICLAQMVSSMCGGDLVMSTKIIASCLQSSMVVVASWSGGGCMSATRTGEMRVY